jgi:DNA (cytosine-5)-methyltransferase 1
LGLKRAGPPPPPHMPSQESRPFAVDLFAGAGGLSLGFAQAGFRIALAVERDPNAGRTYQANHPDTVVFDGDAVYLDGGLVRHVVGGLRLDALIAGPPCQGYSAAGRRRPEDPRNLLFQQVLRLASELRPRFVVVENVPGILSVQGVNFLLPLVTHLRSQGYEVAWGILRACDFGIPQRRDRLFLVAHLDGRPPQRPEPTHCTAHQWPCDCSLPATPTVIDVLQDLPVLGAGENAEHLLPNASTMPHSPWVIAKIAAIRPGQGPRSYRRLRLDMASTLVAGHRALPVHPLLHRMISVREAARLQGFPDYYIFRGSRSSQPLQVANAVPPPMARAVATSLLRPLDSGIHPDSAERPPMPTLQGPRRWVDGVGGG